MEKKVIVFPNAARLVKFIFDWKKYHLAVNFSEKTLTGSFTELEIHIAQTEYGAELQGETAE
jgi:hypothetical protein